MTRETAMKATRLIEKIEDIEMVIDNFSEFEEENNLSYILDKEQLETIRKIFIDCLNKFHDELSKL